MKFFAVALILLLTTKALVAQKENNIWVGGQKSGIDFNSGSPVVFERGDSFLVARASASVCDSQGNLLFYTNGYRIFDKNFQVMSNGDDLDIGDMLTFGNDFLDDNNAVGIVPVPDSLGRYYVFHYDNDFTDVGPDSLQGMLVPRHLFYCVVDMSLNGGYGNVAFGQKDVLMLQDTLTSCGFNLVKHANGRDFWLLVHEYGSNRYYRFLIDPSGVHGPYDQQIGPVIGGLSGLGFSTLQFNTTDDVAAQLMPEYSSIWLYDFDRCTGEFYNPHSFPVAVNSDTASISCAFSPSGRYLYANGGTNWIWQFDLTATDIHASRQFIAQYSGVMNPFVADYAEMELAPDGKIYVNAWDGNHSLHVINYPDSAGVACGFIDNELQLYPPGWDWAGMPNTVHYWLAPVYGSGCDSLTSTNSLPQPEFTFGVYQNPFSNQLQFTVTGVTTRAIVTITNVLGQEVYKQNVQPSDYTIHQAVDASMFASGVYMLSLNENGKLYSQKVVKQ